MVAPTLCAAVQMPMATARSRLSENTTRMMATVDAMIMAAPMPRTTREAISCAVEEDRPAAAEASPKSAKPPRTMRLRPIRSPRVPQVTRSAARVSE